MKFYTNVNRLGNNLLFNGYIDGRRVKKKIKYQPSLFVPTKEDTKWTDLHGNPVRRIKFESMSDMKKYKDENGDVENFQIHGDIKPEYQLITQMFPNTISYDKEQIHIFNFDIEVESADGFPHPEDAAQIINAIAASSSRHKNKYFAWGLGEYDPENDENIREGYTVEYFRFDDEADLLKHFIKFWESDYPDALTGWYIKSFDIPYIVNRTRKILGEEWANRLSPWGKLSAREDKIYDKVSTYYEIFGMQTIDYMDIFQKFGKLIYGEQETYRLDHIAHVVLGKRKVSYEEYGSLYGLYKENFPLYVSYNIRDVSIIDEIDEKTMFINLALTLAYKGGVNYVDTFGTTAIWDSFIYRDLNLKNVAIPPQKDSEETRFIGAYVKPPKVGMSKWVVSFDLNSLYPSVIVQYNMSPETIVTKLEGYDPEYFLSRGIIPDIVKEKNYAIAANGALFRKDKIGVLPRLIIDLYDERVEIKKELKDVERALQKGKTKELEARMVQLDSGQMAVKILLNSLYGATGSRFFRYYDLRIAEGVTLSGQMANKWTEKDLVKYLQGIFKTTEDYCIYMDTDSQYFELKPLIDKMTIDDPVEFLNRFCEKKMEPVIEKSYAELFEYTNGNINRMVMKREAIASSAIWTSKKHYIMIVHDNEGVRYSEPKLKVTGMESKKSSTPEFTRKRLEEGYRIALEGSEVEIQDLVKEVKAEYYTKRPDEIAFPTGVSDIDKWKDSASLYKKGTPIHVRASLVHNRAIDEMGLGDKIEEIQNGNKIKFVYLKQPNVMKENVVAFEGFMPKEFDLDNYIDVDLQFEKTFKGPIESVIKTIGWNSEKIETLEDFF